MTDEESWEMKKRIDRHMSHVATAVAVEADRKFMEGFNMSQGSVSEFAANWQRPEAEYCHFTRGEPENQIQFAFRQNWLEFAKIMEPVKPWTGKRSLEVGAGRGTMSMYFADNGFDVTLLDACDKPLEQASYQFAKHGLECETVTGDAMKLPFEDESFDVVHSYGLLEHFEPHYSIVPAIAEQVRVLRKGGVWIAYIVPFQPNAKFSGMDTCNEAIRMYAGCDHAEKEPVYRNGCTALYYKKFCALADLPRVEWQYVYPFPMIGPSSEFPFSLNPPEIERSIVDGFISDGRWHAYVDECVGDEDPYQALIVWGWKQ